MAERITPEELQELFIDVMKGSNTFSLINGTQPFLITYSGRPYYIYIKHLSSAYFKDRPDTTRAQLPVRTEFEEIKKSSIHFIFLGYDVTNDVYVCWNYHIAKSRLNEKESVSFYSRESFQKEVQNGIFLRKRLKNDDLPVLFKRENLISFFDNINKFFDLTENKDEIMKDEKDYEKDGKIYKITEEELLNKLRLLVNEESNNILKSITVAKEFYGNKYPNMKYSDWSKLIKSVKKVTGSENARDNIMDKQLSVTQIIIEILKERGGEASYTEIYNDYEHFTGTSITDGQKAGIRATIERFSSDSSKFSGKDDLFYSSKGKGSGCWGLRSK